MKKIFNVARDYYSFETIEKEIRNWLSEKGYLEKESEYDAHPKKEFNLIIEVVED
jgi:hypothetical protein